MSERAVASLHRQTSAAPRFVDQASTLRALFARPSVALLPILVPAGHDAARTRWLAELAQAFARSGRRTLVVDAARLQVAAALGLRARYDLLHALRGDCTPQAALLDAGSDLAVLPAARAFQHACAAGAGLDGVVTAAVGALRFDLALLAMPAAVVAHYTASRLRAPDACERTHEMLLPLLPDARDIAAVLAALRAAASTLDAVQRERIDGHGVTMVFRSLFLGMDEASASTLAKRMTARITASAGARHEPYPRIGIEFGAAVRTARELVRVVQAASGWDIEQLTLPKSAGIRTENQESLS